MKNTEQIAETVLRIRDAEQKKLMIRNRRIKKVTAGASTMLVFCAVILAARYLTPLQDKIPTIDDESVINTETPTTITDTANRTTENIGTEHQTKSADNVAKESTSAEKQETKADATETASNESTGNAIKESTSTENQESKADPTEKATNSSADESNAETSGREPTGNTTPSEQQTEGNGNENAIIPKWDERTIQTQFVELNLNGIIYSTRDHNIESYHIGNILGSVTMQGEDVYEDKIHSINAEVFSISDISSNCAIAVKFGGYDKYYVYVNSDYSPATLGELVDALKLNDTISFGTLTPDDRTLVTDYDKSIVSEILNEYRDCATLFDYTDHRKLFSVSASVDILGITNKSFAVTEDGYITTNIMEQGYSFYIGEDRAREIANRLGIDNIERDTTPYTFDPQEEVFYEE